MHLSSAVAIPLIHLTSINVNRMHFYIFLFPKEVWDRQQRVFITFDGYQHIQTIVQETWNRRSQSIGGVATKDLLVQLQIATHMQPEDILTYISKHWTSNLDWERECFLVILIFTRYDITKIIKIIEDQNLNFMAKWSVTLKD